MAQQIIPVVAFGVYRHVAATTVDLFLNTPYTMAAIVDLNIEPSAFRYTPHNLGVVLHTLIPRPQVFITGAMITEEMTYESIAVWEKYVIDCKVEKTLVINVSLSWNMREERVECCRCWLSIVVACWTAGWWMEGCYYEKVGWDVQEGQEIDYSRFLEMENGLMFYCAVYIPFTWSSYPRNCVRIRLASPPLYTNAFSIASPNTTTPLNTQSQQPKIHHNG